MSERKPTRRIAWDEFGYLSEEVHAEMHAEMVDHGRWSVLYERVVRMADDGKYYRYSVYIGATECQETEWPDFVDLFEVVERRVIRWEWVDA